jgi:hypothetical protein
MDVLIPEAYASAIVTSTLIIRKNDRSLLAL